MSRLDFARRQLRRSLIVVVLVICAVASRVVQAYSGDAPNPLSGGWGEQLVNIPNILSLCVLIFHLGVVRQQISDIREQLKDLKEDLPETYARRDLMKKDLEDLQRQMRQRGRP